MWHVQGKPNAMEHFLGHKGNFTLTLTVRMIYDFGWWSLNPVESANIVMNVHGVAACVCVTLAHPCMSQTQQCSLEIPLCHSHKIK